MGGVELELIHHGVDELVDIAPGFFLSAAHGMRVGIPLMVSAAHLRIVGDDAVVAPGKETQRKNHLDIPFPGGLEQPVQPMKEILYSLGH